MAILSRPISAVRRATWIGAALVVALAGCALMKALGPNQKPFGFDHKLHVVDQGLECTDCHANVETADDPGIPALGQCQLCHAETDAQKPPEKQIASLFVDGKFKRTRTAAYSSEIRFPHQKHATSGMDCAVCHGAFDANSSATNPTVTWSMSTCVDCHAERKVSTDCATCHNEIRADVAPPSHARNWPKNHGKVFREKDGSTLNNCAMCHSDTSCNSCHLEQAPDNHTVYWRRRAHGFTARMDRDSCAACHREDSCDRCHSEIQPSTHVGAWGAPTDRHCLTCHMPLKNENCAACHKGTPSHQLAAPKPPGHNPAMNCRMCHGHGQPLPHVDNGDNCNSCHH
jgi:hypothetical protein